MKTLCKFFISFALLATACTGTDLFVDGLEPAPLPSDRVEGRRCAPDPIQRDVTVKLLVVVDTSGSNTTNDPTNRRATALQTVINQFIASVTNATLSIGIIGFADQADRLTLGFTQSLAILNSALQAIGAAGATNYSDTIAEILQFILDDLALLTPAERALTRYQVEFLSDGEPTRGNTNPLVFNEGIQNIVDAIGPQVNGLTFNTAFIGSVNPAGSATAIALLDDMASAGGGTFTNLDVNEEIMIDVDDTAIILEQELLGIIVNNRSGLPGPDGPLRDSDQDGIPDIDEPTIGTDPAVYDTDGDGLGDGVEFILRTDFNPNVADPGCSSPTDTDGDGLRDCEELAIGTNMDEIDSDDDLVPDRVEFFLGSSAITDNPAFDQDLDGLFDTEEVTRWLSARIPNDAELSNQLAYIYDVVPEDAQPGNTLCYDISVSNITILPTIETDISSEGENTIQVIEIYGNQTLNATERTFRVSNFAAFFIQQPPLSLPANGIFEFSGTM